MGQQTMLNRAVTGCKVSDKDMTRESGGEPEIRFMGRRGSGWPLGLNEHGVSARGEWHLEPRVPGALRSSIKETCARPIEHGGRGRMDQIPISEGSRREPEPHRSSAALGGVVVVWRLKSGACRNY